MSAAHWLRQVINDDIYYIVRTRPIGARPIEARPDPTRPEQLGIKKRPDYGALSLGVITL